MTLTVWLLTATLALTLLPSNVVPTAVPLLRQEWSASDAELGGVFTAYRLGHLVAVLLVLPLTVVGLAGAFNLLPLARKRAARAVGDDGPA